MVCPLDLVPIPRVQDNCTTQLTQYLELLAVPPLLASQLTDHANAFEEEEEEEEEEEKEEEEEGGGERNKN